MSTTKQDSATEQPTSKPKDSGKTDSSKAVPYWHQGPKELTRREQLRRQYKKFYGFKPCGMTEKELERVVLARESERSLRDGSGELVPESRATIGDALEQKR